MEVAAKPRVGRPNKSGRAARKMVQISELQYNRLRELFEAWGKDSGKNQSYWTRYALDAFLNDEWDTQMAKAARFRKALK